MIKILLQFVEILGYFSQYVYLTFIRQFDYYIKNLPLVCEYIKLCCYDNIDYYYIYLILALPASVFGAPILKIQQTGADNYDSSDDENIAVMKKYEVFVSELTFVYKSNDIPPIMTKRVMNGAQLRPLIDDKGRFFLGHIGRYYPTLDTIEITYVKLLTSKDSVNTENTITMETKVIDVKKRYDVRNSKSCKFGVYL